MKIRPPSFNEWKCTTGTLSPYGQNGVRLTGASTALTCQMVNTVPGARVSIEMGINATGVNPVVVIGDQVRRIQRGNTRIGAETSCGETLEISISGIRDVYVTSISVFSVDASSQGNQPRDVLSLQAFFPIRGLDGFRLDTHRLNRASLNRPQPSPKAFVLNRDHLDTQRLYFEGATLAWQDVTRNVTALQVRRGVSATGGVFTAQVGTLTISALDDLDPRVLGLSYGTPFKLIHWPSRTPLFTGVLTDQTVTRHPPGDTHAYDTQITVSDAVARLAATTRYGARAEGGDGSEAWAARIPRLMKSAPEVTYRIPSTTYTRMCATVWETSLASHLDAATASVCGSWMVERDNTVSVTAARPSLSSQIAFTDTDPSAPPLVWSYTESDTQWESSQTISAVNVTNHGARREDGEWRAEDTTLTERNTTYAAAWLGTAANVDMTLESGISEAAKRLLRKSSDTPTPTALTIRPSHAYGPKDSQALMESAAYLDPLTPVLVQTRGETSNAIVTTVTHSITPEAWTTSLTLTPNQ